MIFIQYFIVRKIYSKFIPMEYPGCSGDNIYQSFQIYYFCIVPLLHQDKISYSMHLNSFPDIL